MIINAIYPVHLNLPTGTHKPFMKENSKPTYINVCSNHPPAILKQIPNMIQKRISNLSSSKEIFLNDIKPYQDALINAGHKQNLEFSNETNTSNRTRTRKKDVTWYNPPFNASVTTNFAAKFLRLVDKHFVKGSPFNKIFNRNTIKVSYSCLPNLEQIISSHNKKVLRSSSTDNTVKKLCNCRNGSQDCPLQGNCLNSSLIYKAEVSANLPPNNNLSSQGIAKKAEYIGLASNTFKERYSNHQMSFRHERHQNSTGLSKYVWKLKRNNIPFSIQWSKITNAAPYNPVSNKCNLCTLEKVYILRSDHNFPLNLRTELISKCRHRDKFLLSKL